MEAIEWVRRCVLASTDGLEETCVVLVSGVMTWLWGFGGSSSGGVCAMVELVEDAERRKISSSMAMSVAWISSEYRR